MAELAREKAARVVERGRLAYYLRKADVNLWENTWRDQQAEEVYRRFESGDLGYYESIFPAYLPKQGRILEAGCGLGQLVLALRRRGYDCEGMDWAAETVRRIKNLRPDLNVRTGNVLSIDAPDGAYSAYISVGVMEHLREGPEPFLREARRVVRDDGVFLIAVPHFTPLRRLKAFFGRYPADIAGLEFFQYAFTVPDFSRCLLKCGIRPHRVLGYEMRYGLFEEWPFLARQMEKRRGGWRLKQWMTESPFCNRLCGHMVLFVCRKG